jgi:transcriptional regulator NrdR family protein
MKKKECVVKRHGNEEKFDERKVYASCYAACLTVRIKEEKAEKICEKVAKQIKKHISKKTCVSSDDIFNQTAKLIEKYDEDAAFMYKSHRDIS